MSRTWSSAPAATFSALPWTSESTTATSSPLRDERVDDVRADEPGASGDDRPHERILWTAVGWRRCSSRSRVSTARGSRRRPSSCARGSRRTGRGRVDARAGRHRARRGRPRPRPARRARRPVGRGAAVRRRARPARRRGDPSRARARRVGDLRPLPRLVGRVPGRRRASSGSSGCSTSISRRSAACCPTGRSCSSSTPARSPRASSASFDRLEREGDEFRARDGAGLPRAR